MAQYKVIHKSPVFTLISIQKKRDTHYHILVNVVAQESLPNNQLQDIKNMLNCDFATPHRNTKFCWMIDVEDEAKAMYNWLSVKWPTL